MACGGGKRERERREDRARRRESAVRAARVSLAGEHCSHYSGSCLHSASVNEVKRATRSPLFLRPSAEANPPPFVDYKRAFLAHIYHSLS